MLILTAYPRKDGFTRYCTDLFMRGVQQTGIPFTVIDLTATGIEFLQKPRRNQRRNRPHYSGIGPGTVEYENKTDQQHDDHHNQQPFIRPGFQKILQTE
ncbi:MAG: hypothetical protein JW863_05255 [Chitinispirillaceae bacterium]|nr:hypothetical protein [Chitinispirillaceae bacterium]